MVLLLYLLLKTVKKENHIFFLFVLFFYFKNHLTLNLAYATIKLKNFILKGFFYDNTYKIHQ